METDKNTTTDYRSVLASAEEFLLARGAVLSPSYSLTDKGWSFHACVAQPFQFVGTPLGAVALRASLTLSAQCPVTRARVRCSRTGYPTLTFRLSLPNKGQGSKPEDWRAALASCAKKYAMSFSNG